MKTIEERLDSLEAQLDAAAGLTKKRKKQLANGYLSFSTGCPEHDDKMFNKAHGTDFPKEVEKAPAQPEAVIPEAGTNPAPSAPDVGGLAGEAGGAMSGDAGASTGDAGAAAGGEGGAMGESLEESTLTESSLTFEEHEFEDGYVLECRWDKNAGYEIIGGYKRGDGMVHDDYHRSYPSKEAAMKYFKVLCRKHGKIVDEDVNENLTEETKRYVKRYYIRPQNIFCSNKTEILQALVELEDENCSVYSLKSLSDHDDVHLLKPSDIIYYYDDGIIYDKNHVKVMDYDLSPKHEEERKKYADVDTVTDREFAGEYDDRLTDVTQDDTIKVDDNGEAVAEDIEARAENPFNENWDSYTAYGTKLTEDKGEVCCICGEELFGYGNNAEPYKSGRCCDACNVKFVIPARMKELSSETDEEE